MSPRRILLHEGIESSSAPFYDRKFDESTDCRVQGRRAAKTTLKYMYASCDVCWIFPLSYMLLL